MGKIMIKQMHQNLFCQISLFIALTFGLTFGNHLQATEYFGSTNYVYDASQCHPPSEPPCPPSIFDSKAVLILGSSLIAAGVGAGIALAVQNSRRGRSGTDGTNGTNGIDGTNGTNGANGATGPAGVSFISDTGQTLTFNFFLETPPAGLTGTARAFVTLPDGTTSEGGSVSYTSGAGPGTMPSITISNPLFGFYNAGVQLITASATGLGGGAPYTLRINVFASRDGSTSYLPAGIGDTLILPATTPVITEAQLDVSFTYDPANVP